MYISAYLARERNIVWDIVNSAQGIQIKDIAISFKFAVDRVVMDLDIPFGSMDRRPV